MVDVRNLYDNDLVSETYPALASRTSALFSNQ